MKLSSKYGILAVAALSLSVPALAQDVRAASERVVACQSEADAEARLACFEAAASDLAAVLAAPVQQAAVTPSPETPAASQAAASTPVTTAAVSPNAVEQPAATQTASVETDAPDSGLPSWIPRITFGNGRDVEKEPDEYRTEITKIQVNRLGRHFFTTSDGHVWKQKSPSRIRAPKTLPAEVVLYQNIAGGLQLKIVETNRIYGVSRIE